MNTHTLVETGNRTFCKLHYRKIPGPVNLPALSHLFSRQGFCAILGGNAAVADAGRFTCWTAWPVEVFEFGPGQKDPFTKLQQAIEKYRLHSRCKDGLPKGIFTGGWAGYFSYELGRYIEQLPQTAIDDLGLPLIRLCFYDRVIAYDHLEKTVWLIALQMPNDTEKPLEKLTSLEKLLKQANNINLPKPPACDLNDVDLSQPRCNMNTEYYLRMAEKIKRYIYDGDVYQVNFSQRFECDYAANPIDLFHWQNYYNPSPYAAYIDAGDFCIVSASPEMFVTIADGTISTKPIKGTRPRVGNTAQNNAYAGRVNAENFNQLAQSQKEQAELNMIIDLERNDLTRICEYGTIKVTQPRTIEAYPTVFHAVATVTGRLRDETGFCDILKAMFPGGSITGAPKIRSMEIIDETEPVQRAVYTGSIGFVGIDGSVCLNIAIRTIIIKSNKAFVQTGGGIVADSEPKAELDETITKAKALLAGINSVQRAADSGQKKPKT